MRRSIFLRWNFGIAAAALLIVFTPVLAQPPAPQPQQQGGPHASGPAPRPELKAARQALRQACMQDIRTLCAGSEPGGGKILMCLRSHRDQVSDGCKAATQHLRDVRRGT